MISAAHINHEGQSHQGENSDRWKEKQKQVKKNYYCSRPGLRQVSKYRNLLRTKKSEQQMETDPNLGPFACSPTEQRASSPLGQTDRLILEGTPYHLYSMLLFPQALGSRKIGGHESHLAVPS